MYRGDNTSFNNNKFITIEIENPNNVVLSKAVFRCGAVVKTFENPTSILEVNFSEEESKLLAADPVGYLAVYDKKGRKWTCEGSVTFSTKGGVV